MEITKIPIEFSSNSRDDWITIGRALKSLDSKIAFCLWDAWSKTSHKYNADEMEKRWNSFKPDHEAFIRIFIKG